MRKVLKPGAVKDLLSGTFLGHPLHPMLTDVPIGTWTSAVILDLVGGRESQRAADLLIGTGVAAALPTAASGYSDWADTVQGNPSARRIGLVHAASNVSALALYSASLIARRRGRRGRGVALALSGLGALGLGGHLGGHLSYAEAVGVDQTAFDSLPEEWTPTLAETMLGDGQAVKVEAGDVPVLLTRQAGQIFAIHDRCSHRGGPLHEGEIADWLRHVPVARQPVQPGGRLRSAGPGCDASAGVRDPGRKRDDRDSRASSKRRLSPKK